MSMCRVFSCVDLLNTLNDHHHKSSSHLSPCEIITVLLTIFIMLHITSSWLTYLRTACLYILIPFTYFTHHLSPFPLEPFVCSLYLWVCFCPVCLFFCFVFFFLTKRISKIIKYLSFSLWLILLSIRNSRSIQIVINGNISFYFISECVYIYICIHTYIFSSYLSIFLSMNIGCFHILAIVILLQ